MSKKVAEKLADLEYNEQVTLAIVEGEDDLRNIFIDETKVKSFVLLRTLAKANQLNNETKSFLRMIFDQVILTKQELIDKYHLLSSKGEFVEDYKDVISVATFEVPKVAEPVIQKSKDIFKGVKEPKEKEIPRRYGKEKILRDIEAQGGNATPLQNAMLKVNGMKNIYVNLNARLIKDMFGKDRILSDEDYRTINSVMMIMERKLEDILKKK